MKFTAKVLSVCITIVILGLASMYVYNKGVSAGHTQGGDEMSRQWIDGCTKGMTLELNGVTINCYQGGRA